VSVLAGRITPHERRRLAAQFAAALQAIGVPTDAKEGTNRACARRAIVRALDQLGYVSIHEGAEIVHELPTEERQISGESCTGRPPRFV
jgi:hypothetical protein